MKHKPKTLVILSPGFPSDEADTPCLPAQQVFVKAINRNYPQLRVVVIAFEYPFRRDDYCWFDNRIIAVGGWKDGWINKFQTMRTVWKLLNKLRKKNEVIGLLSFWLGGCALVGKYYSKAKGLPHHTWILGQDARPGNRFVPLVRPTAGDLIAMSDFLAKEFKKNYGIRPAHIIPNGVDASLYGPAPAVRDIDVLGVGSLIPLKQYELFVAVIHRLSRILPGIRAVLCGKGPERDRLMQLIEKQGLQANIELVGEKPHAEAIGLMQRTKILLHPSSYEGFSTVCLEALFAGARVISFCDPVGSRVANWYIVAGEEEMTARALSLLQDSRLRFSPTPVYTMDDSAKKIVELFNYSETKT
ncbi:MAG TPA: glycosyltransferase family 4 protein [Puia sp.]|uniref:glycosyltransferase family 4 protein n=1 Tax=Puia sp. TaxID=2045100 RepID=UPI002CE561DF|nr:glycosyltransferase family 4 protein [Puia sp.]HVU98270.1 glycosyltransferase family 4 protein [Puia sp.]